jgi:diguanylate cyclase (GGDEF)-like protein/putative nucleotidyltransferase with HDIG domain
MGPAGGPILCSHVTPRKRVTTICGIPRRVFLYIAAITAGAVPAVVIALTAIALDPPPRRIYLPVLLFGALSLAADLRPVPMDADRNDKVSIANVFIVTTAILFGVRYAVPMACVSIGVAQLLNRGTLRHRMVFNVSMYTLAAVAAGLPNWLFGTVEGSGVRLAGYVLLGGAAQLVVNVVALALAIGLSERIPFLQAVLPGLRNGGAAFAIMTFLAALAANLWRLDPLLLVLLTGPLFTVTLYQRSAHTSRVAARDALTDNLTGLGNHRAYQAALREHIDASERSGDHFAVCLVDVDNFKELNDFFGHPAGDDVLVKIARLLDGPADASAYRFGGDEFVVLVERDEVEAYRLLERIQRQVAEADLCPGRTVTISVGIAAFPAQATDADELQRTADGALYWSKAHGKNRSCIYSPSVVRIYSPEEFQREAERSALLQAAKNVVRFVDAKDPSTANHSQIVSKLAESLAVELELGPELVEQLRLAGLLHDLGKIGVPDEILKAPRALTAAEFEIVKKHPEIGYSLLDGLDLDPVDRWVLHHHEHWDGSGYPAGLAGEEIPLGSRIVLVADAFEAITANRPYRRAQSPASALAELAAKAGIQFDPDVVAALQRVLSAEPRELSVVG